MFSFSASYLQIKSGLHIPQNYKYLISNKKVFLYKYAKILTCVLTIIRGVVLTVWLMEQHAVSAHVSTIAATQPWPDMSHDCIQVYWYTMSTWDPSAEAQKVFFPRDLIGCSSKSHMCWCLLVMVVGYDPDLLTWGLLLH